MVQYLQQMCNNKSLCCAFWYIHVLQRPTHTYLPMCICTHVAFLLLVGMLLQRWNR